ncbi:mechanosensitive ion channel family protein [uncultured Methanobrevibacter sp.]|uniref:mechanosensitive ion channel family protein n=1 Tax=uncultured Methanobrevibacter sp. TaxID=253161 RepID=UPI0025E3DE0C|nr:mechanosensitive ion channel domain-containing protein [uncultured Methanobrevibacter sp.]
MDLLTTFDKNLQILVYIIIIIVSTTIITKLIEYLIKKRAKFNKDMTATLLMKDIVIYSLYFIALMYILQLFGVNLAGTLLSLGIVGIAVSFAAKDIISNLFSGILLILGKSIKVGDTIEIDGEKGTVQRVSLRSTTIIDELGVVNHVPNSTLTNNPYFEFKSNELRRVDIIVGLPLDIDVEEFRDYITEKIVTYDEITDSPRPNVFVRETSFKQIKVKVSFWVKDFDTEDSRKLIIDNKDKYKLVIANEIRKYINNMGEKNE